MTPDAFRKIALSLPEAEEREHMAHPDFRVHGKIFATLFRRHEVDWGVVKLRPDQQREFIAQCPEIFEAGEGGWGRSGYARVRLAAVKRNRHSVVRDALFAAWCNTAPKRLLEKPPRETPKSR